MRRGMSLVEVLVALAIFALAAVGLSAAYGNLLLARAALNRAEGDDEAMRLARAAVLAPETLKDRTVGGSGERLEGRLALSDGTTAEWTAELAGGGVDGLFVARLTVRREGEVDGRAQEFHVYRPAWAGSADRQAALRAATERLRAGRDFEGTLGSSAAPSGGSRPSTRRPEGGGEGAAKPNAGGRPGGRPEAGPRGEPEGRPGSARPGQGGGPRGPRAPRGAEGR